MPNDKLEYISEAVKGHMCIGRCSWWGQVRGFEVRSLALKLCKDSALCKEETEGKRGNQTEREGNRREDKETGILRSNSRYKKTKLAASTLLFRPCRSG